MPDLPVARLGSLIRLLGSDRDGEILSTVAAISRTLVANGSDWHSLAERLASDGKIPEAEMRRLYDAGFDAGKRAAEAEHAANPGFANVGPKASWLEIAEFCKNRKGLLQSREDGFVTDMTVRLRFRPPTDKQAAWLATIYLRCGGDAARVPEQ